MAENLTEYDDDSWDQAWVEVARQGDNPREWAVQIVGYFKGGFPYSEEAHAVLVHNEIDMFHAINSAIDEARRIDAGWQFPIE